MSQNNKETLTNISNEILILTKKIKKEHFTKLILHITTFFVIIICIFLLIFSTTPLSNGVIKPILKPLYAFVENENGLDAFNGIKGTWNLVQEMQAVDNNGLYVFNLNSNNIVSSLSILGGSGWIAFLIYLSIVKNMITPQFIKKTVRQGLQFGYVKQADVDFITNEIDYNIGIKNRSIKEEGKDENIS